MSEYEGRDRKQGLAVLVLWYVKKEMEEEEVVVTVVYVHLGNVTLLTGPS